MPRRPTATDRLEADFLAIGSGLAGLTWALEVADRGSVIVVTKRAAEEGNTRYAQGGIAAVLAPDDSFEAHIADTLRAGAGLCHGDTVDLCVRQGPERVRELIRLGVAFTRREELGEPDPAGEGYDLGKEGGHSARRVIHAEDFTGREVERALLEAARAHRNIRVLEDHIAIDLLMASRQRRHHRRDDRCLGAYVLDVRGGRVVTVRAPVTMLATGGAGKVYLYTSNPDVATGDGVAIAWRAGATVANLEFVQFHPTCLYHPQAKSFLVSEALRGEGGVLRRADGTAFMAAHHPLKDLAPRDVVAHAIDAELKRSGDDCVFLDMTGVAPGFLERRFPNIHRTVLSFGIDMRERPIPVVPAAHYMCGGVVTDLGARTSVPGLLAAGEVACTGLHGANRLASNSLLEALVFGHEGARTAIDYVNEDSGERLDIAPWDSGDADDPDEQVVVSQNWDEIRRTMWNYVGIVRTVKRLHRAAARIDLMNDEITQYYWDFKVTRDMLELRNVATVADLIIRCALARKESRGLHYCLDYPDRAVEEGRDTVLTGHR
jgi:L-aspartate oxidase